MELLDRLIPYFLFLVSLVQTVFMLFLVRGQSQATSSLVIATEPLREHALEKQKEKERLREAVELARSRDQQKRPLTEEEKRVNASCQLYTNRGYKVPGYLLLEQRFQKRAADEAWEEAKKASGCPVVTTRAKEQG